jgi:hypothetical protein
MARLVIITLLPDNDRGARVCNSTPPRQRWWFIDGCRWERLAALPQIAYDAEQHRRAFRVDGRMPTMTALQWQSSKR